MNDGQVTVVKDGRVVMKIITNDHGDRVRVLARAIRRLGKNPTPDAVYRLALALGFGSYQTLTMQSALSSTHQLYVEEEDREVTVRTELAVCTVTPHAEDDCDVPPQYSKGDLFSRPKFSPYKNGRASHLAIVQC